MTNRNVFTSTAPLFRLKLRLLLNTFFNWTSAARLTAAVFVMAITSYAMASAATELVEAFQAIPFGPFLLEWVLAIICIYLSIIVFTGDLITGHSLNAGQMSSDFAYLTTLPIPPLGLILVKLFERMLTDYIGLLILLTGTLGIIFRGGFSVSGLMAGLIIYFQISLLIGLSINLLMICMQRFFRTATINNLFSLLGYISAFLTLFPYLVLSNFPGQSLSWLIEYSDSFTAPIFTLIEPFRWLAVSLLNRGNCTEFIYWSAFCLITTIVGCLFFYLMIRLNWLTCSHSAAKRKTAPGRRIFSGFFQKELILLKSDFNMLVNAILMPVTIIILEILVLKNAISFGAAGQTLNIIYAAVIYFCMFGPINSVGAEGKSISIIESLPMSCADFLFRKFLFWVIIAEAIFIPATIAAHEVLNFTNARIAEASGYIFFFTCVCVWISVHVSAIFPKFESKILQQKSSLTGKFIALSLMLLAAPIKTPDLVSLLNLLVLAVSIILVREMSIKSLSNRLDPDFSLLSPKTLQPYVVLILVFVGVEIALKQFFLAIIPSHDTGLSSWLIASLIFFPATFVFIGKSLSGKHAQKLWNNLIRLPDAMSSVVILIASLIYCYEIKFLIFRFATNFSLISAHVKSLFIDQASIPMGVSMDYLSVGKLLDESINLLGTNNWFIAALVIIPLLAIILEIAFRGILLEASVANKGLHRLAILLSIIATVAIAPTGLSAIFALTGLSATILFKKFGSLPAVCFFSATAGLTIFLTLLFL